MADRGHFEIKRRAYLLERQKREGRWYLLPKRIMKKVSNALGSLRNMFRRLQQGGDLETKRFLAVSAGHLRPELGED
jgi:hypothetical protein